MQLLKVRRGVPDDFAAIWVINAEGQPGVSPFTSTELARLLADPGHVWVVTSEDRHPATVAGYCVTYTSSEKYDGEEFAWFKDHYPSFLYIDQIAVATSHLRAGIGTLLYAAIDQAAHEQGLPALACEVNIMPPNPTSLAFHMRVGFAEVGTLDVTDGRSVLLLVKPIDR